jgi:hypothetical protein
VGLDHESVLLPQRLARLFGVCDSRHGISYGLVRAIRPILLRATQQ